MLLTAGGLLGGLSQGYSSLSEALATLSRVSGWRLAELDKIEAAGVEKELTERFGEQVLGVAAVAVDAGERIICVEDAPELAPAHPHLVRLVARGANVEGVGEITLRQLVRQALRMRPDRIVVGEVRGAEVVDLLAAMNTGHDGGAGTVHANSPAEVPARLEALGALGGLDRGALHSQLAAAVQVVVHVSRSGRGRGLAELALLRRDDAGLVRVIPAWRAGDGLLDGAAALNRLIAQRCG